MRQLLGLCVLCLVMACGEAGGGGTGGGTATGGGDATGGGTATGGGAATGGGTATTGGGAATGGGDATGGGSATGGGAGTGGGDATGGGSATGGGTATGGGEADAGMNTPDAGRPISTSNTMTVSLRLEVPNNTVIANNVPCDAAGFTAPPYFALGANASATPKTLTFRCTFIAPTSPPRPWVLFFEARGFESGSNFTTTSTLGDGSPRLPSNVSVQGEWSTGLGAPDFIGRVITTTLDYEAGYVEGTIDFTQNSQIQGSSMPTFDIDGTFVGTWVP